MRRILKCLLAALWIALALALLTTATADPDKAGCPVSSEHDWKLEHVNSATCDSEGTKYWHCDNCQQDTTETIPELGHDYQYESQDATCTDAGYTRNKCTRCGDIFDQIDIPALGHNPEDLPEKAATCTEDGLTKGTRCKRCGWILDEQVTIQALGHDWDGGVVTTAATCTAAGTKTFTCTRCGATRTEAIPATGHSPVSIPAVAATCEAAGKTEGSQCSVCGTILTAQTEIAALGHSWDSGSVTAAATCTAAGTKTFTCTRCGATRTEAIPATGHSPVSIPAVAATCEAGGKTEGSQCSVCGTLLTAQTDTPALGHSWDGGAVTTAATCTAAGTKTFTCTRCGATRTEAIPATGHSPVSIPAVAATCETGGKTEGSQCSVCGTVLTAQTDTPALGHSWDGGAVTTAATCTAAGTKTFTCTRCGATRTEAIPATGHFPVSIPAVAATCETGGKTEGSQCSVCGTVLTAQTDTPALGHSWDGGAVTTAATCTAAGTKTFTCIRCGATRTESVPAAGHSPVSIPAVAATCEAGGKTEGSQCSVCGAVLTAQTDTPALGHSWDGGTVTTAATCTAAGTNTFTCTRCGTTRTETIPAAGHTPVALPAIPAACGVPGKTEGSQCSVCGAVLTAQTDIPALEHVWSEWVTEQQATCTEAGQEYRTCRNCGQQERRPVPAWNHDWDEGQAIGEDGILVPGVLLYTCKTCGETKSETLPLQESGASVIAGILRNGGAGADGDASQPDGTELRIVTQPVGGTVLRNYDEPCVLTVEVAGGVPPYQYQWYMESLSEPDGSGTSDPVTETLSGAVEYIMGRYSSSSKLVAAAVRGTDAARGWNLSQPDAAQARVVCTVAEPWKSETDPERPGTALAGEESDRFEALAKGRYYCKITDQEGNSVWSDSADVWWRIRIVARGQTGSNLYEEPVVMYVNVKDGVLEPGQDYTYRWIDHVGNEYLEPENPRFLHVPTSGLYCCEVSDGVDTANSGWMSVYDYETLECHLSFPEEKYQFLDPDGEAVINLDAQGGIPPFTIAWGLFGEEEIQQDVEKPELHTQRHVTQAGLYHLSISDNLGNFAEDWVRIYTKPISILTQPESGTLPKDWEPYTLSIMMDDGQQPFTYTLYETDDYGNYYPVAEKEGENWKTSFDVYFEGDYYIEVLDSEGGWVRSDTVRVDAYHNLEVKPIPDGVIDDPDEPYHVEVKASGGELPYRYEWYVRGKEPGSREIKMTNTKSSIDLFPDASEEWYWCVVTDAAGEKVRSDDVTVRYTGTKPFITKHPVSWHNVTDGGSMPTLTCEAICGNGRKPRYQWEYFLDGVWHDTNWRTNEYTPNADIVRGGGGAYRCVVFDTTGQSVESKTASVFMDMKVLSYQQEGTEKLLKLDFKGGVAPFEIKVTSYHAEPRYLVNYDYSYENFGFTMSMWYSELWTFVHDTTRCCKIQVTNDYDHTLVDIGIPYLYTREQIKKEWNFVFLIPFPTNTYQKFPYLYMVKVTDAIGQTMMTQYVTCQWD